ncbi:hypothetical protein [Demequina sp. NBRC 110056]|uniref:hypothetical protein n=1 Tax=Demequina sp. NBRC 110056 TaxID=1570345 RepID=UPI000A0531AF|nr:hypothetical protein [Demequina sp. NBRC 110056]
MTARLKALGIVLAVIGLGFIGVGAFAYLQVAAGQHSLEKFSEAQNVTLTYNEDGQLIDRGEVAGAEGIIDLVENDWGYSLKSSELDPNDPLVNTGSEYMYQMGLVAYHTLHGTTTVTLDEDVEYNGETFAAGTYEVATDGKYWADFDRMHPLEGPARAEAWTATAHALIGELGVGSVTANVLVMGLGVAAIAAGLGVTLIIAGGGLIWAVSGDKKKAALKEAPAIESIDEPVKA